MKITSVEAVFADLVVFMETDKGITTFAALRHMGDLDASAGAISKFADYLVGKDPRTIEHHWNVMMRFSNFTGAGINGAISAIDIALWDITGKWLGVPIYQLLGGKVRDKARVYAHCKGRTGDKLVARATHLKAEGYTALGCMNPFLDEGFDSPWFLSHAEKMQQGADNVRRVREAVGLGVDLCIEIHCRMTPTETLTLGRLLEPSLPMFLWKRPASRQPGRHGVARRHHPNPDRDRRALRDAAAVPGPDDAARCGIPATLHNSLRRHHRRQEEDRRDGGGTRHADRIPQPTVAGEPGRLPATRRLHPEFRDPGISIRQRRHRRCRRPARKPRGVPGLPLPEGGFIAIPDRPGLGIELPADLGTRYPRVDPGPVVMRPHRDGFVVEE